MRFRLVMEGGERNLRSIEKLVGPVLWNRLDEYAMGGASKEVSDAFITGKRGHGFAVSGASLVGGVALVGIAPFCAFHVRIVGALPCGAATLDGGLGLFGVEVNYG